MAPHLEVRLTEKILSPMALRDLGVAKTLVPRSDTYHQLASAGAKSANRLSGPGIQIVFALIAVAMTLTALWFFFIAKNGGFLWRGKEDWDDYKSTVLRRKGPDGQTLSNATKSTRLGGGSVVHGGSYGAESSIGYTEETDTSADVTEYRDTKETKAEEGRAGLRGGDGREPKKHRRDHTNNYKDPELREYRHEKAARVGGLNRAADGMYTDYSESGVPSELGSNVSSRPLMPKEGKVDRKKAAKEKELRAKERMRNAKAAEKGAAKTAAVEAKARKETLKAEAKREKEREKAAYKKNKKTRSEATPSESPEMAEVTRPLTDYHTEYSSEYTRAYTEYSAPSVAPVPSGPRRAPPSAAYSFTTGDDTNTVYTGAYTDDGRTDSGRDNVRDNGRSAPRSTVAPSEANESSYYSDYRPNADPSAYTPVSNNPERRSRSRPSPTPERQLRQAPSGARTRPAGARSSRSTSQSPKKQYHPVRSNAPSDIFTANNGEATGHMSYPCHIPGLSQAGSVGVGESVSQVGAPSRRQRDVMDGYRRGGVRTVGRRDSLSDSELD